MPTLPTQQDPSYAPHRYLAQMSSAPVTEQAFAFAQNCELLCVSEPPNNADQAEHRLRPLGNINEHKTVCSWTVTCISKAGPKSRTQSRMERGQQRESRQLKSCDLWRRNHDSFLRREEEIRKESANGLGFSINRPPRRLLLNSSAKLSYVTGRTPSDRPQSSQFTGEKKRDSKWYPATGSIRTGNQ